MWPNYVSKNYAFNCYSYNRIVHGPKDHQVIDYMKFHDDKLKIETITNDDTEVQNEMLVILIMFLNH
jgi:hypothetical protein